MYYSLLLLFLLFEVLPSDPPCSLRTLQGGCVGSIIIIIILMIMEPHRM